MTNEITTAARAAGYEIENDEIVPFFTNFKKSGRHLMVIDLCAEDQFKVRANYSPVILPEGLEAEDTSGAVSDNVIVVRTGSNTEAHLSASEVVYILNLNK